MQSPSRFSISLIVPTYNERPNLRPLVAELFEVLAAHPDIDAEVIVVDDGSPDGTAVVARELSHQYPLRLLQRQGKRGLGSAVMAGFTASNRDYLGVMDADLSHDPSVLPRMIRALGVHDVVIGSRFGVTSRVERWTRRRRWLSCCGVALARRLVGVEDPLSGYFCLRRPVLVPLDGRLVSSGYKILFEILARGCVSSHASIDYVFRQRCYSTSKLNLREYLLFVRQLVVFGFASLCVSAHAGHQRLVMAVQQGMVRALRPQSRSASRVPALGDKP